MRILFSLLLLAFFPANLDASFNRHLDNLNKEALKDVLNRSWLEPKGIEVNITKNTKLFLDGKQIDKLPDPNTVIVEHIIIQKETMEALAIYFKSVKVKD